MKSQSVSCSVMSNSLRPHGLWPTRLLCPWDISQARILEWVAVRSSRGSSQPGSNRGLPGHRQILYSLSRQVVRAQTFDFIQFFFFGTNIHQHNVLFIFVMLAATGYHWVGLLCHKGLPSSHFFMLFFLQLAYRQDQSRYYGDCLLGFITSFHMPFNLLLWPLKVPVNWISSVQSLSCVWLFATPWIEACQASLSITNSWSSLKPMSIESVMPSSHLILCHPLLLLPPIPPSARVFSSESTLRMRWPKYWSFSFSISPSIEHPVLIL